MLLFENWRSVATVTTVIKKGPRKALFVMVEAGDFEHASKRLFLNEICVHVAIRYRHLSVNYLFYHLLGSVNHHRTDGPFQAIDLQPIG